MWDQLFDPLQPHGHSPFAAFERQPLTRRIHQNLTHQAGRDVIEVRAIRPIRLALLGQAQEGLAEQLRRREFAVSPDRRSPPVHPPSRGRRCAIGAAGR